MPIREIIEKDIHRNDENVNIATFHLCNGGWYRAYEWSAYIVSKYLKDSNSSNMLKVLHKPLKGVENGYVFVGLKMESFDKYFPFIKEDETRVTINDGLVEVKFDVEVDVATMNEKLNDLRRSVPYNKTSNDSEQIDSNAVGLAPSIERLLKEITSYQIESKTPIESIIFLSKIKNEVSNILK